MKVTKVTVFSGRAPPPSSNILDNTNHDAMRDCVRAPDWGSFFGPQGVSARVEIKKYIFCGVTYTQFVSLISQNKCHQRVYLVDGDDFYFWILKKIFTILKVRALRKSMDPFFRDHVFSNSYFPSQTLHKKLCFFFWTRVSDVHEPQSGARRE